MSQQLAATKKRKQGIGFITSFFQMKDGSMTKKPRVEIIHGGRVKTINCGYCGKGYTPQGIKAHEMWHAGNGHVRDPTQFLNFGRVKVRGEPYSGAKSTSNVEDAEDVDADKVIDCMAEDTEEAETASAMVMIIDEHGNPHDSVSQESGAVAIIVQESLTASNMSIFHHIQILDFYHDNRTSMSKNAITKWVMTQSQFNCHKFSRQNLNTFLKNEMTIQGSLGTKQKTKYVVNGAFPEMEIQLAEWIAETRELGVPVETFMLPLIGHEMLVEQFPEAYTDQENPGFVEPLMFSNNWRVGFFGRFGFAVQRFTTTKTILRDKVKVAEACGNFHLETHAFQLSLPGIPKDPIYGITSPYAVFNRDQVPIALCPSVAKTVDNTGAPVVLNSLDLSNKRFCTLNLTISMRVRPDCRNVPKCHLVFRGGFKGGKDWVDAEERAKFYPQVVVVFQENAWVDAKTKLYGLEKCMKPIDDSLATESFDGVQFEDNLSAHKTDSIAEYWNEVLQNFHALRYYAAQLTLLIQAIDHHQGTFYKIAVTKAVQAFLVEKMEQAKRDGTEFDPGSAISISERQILITKVVADTHDRLANE
jgi:hypothetical protein